MILFASKVTSICDSLVNRVSFSFVKQSNTPLLNNLKVNVLRDEALTLAVREKL